MRDYFAAPARREAPKGYWQIYYNDKLTVKHDLPPVLYTEAGGFKDENEAYKKSLELNKAAK